MRVQALQVFAVASVLAGLGLPSARAVTFTVNSTLDLPDGDPTDGICATSPPGAPVCTLRAAVMQANATAGFDKILVPAGTYVLTRVGYDGTALLGDLDVTDDVEIEGNGGTVVIDANGATTYDRAFEVVSGSLQLAGMTIENGNTPADGGAIRAAASLALRDVIVQDSSAGGDGGGVFSSSGDMNVSDSTFQRNGATRGGAVAIEESGSAPSSLSIERTLIAHNSSSGEGGGIFANGNATTQGEQYYVRVVDSELHDNSGSAGGAIYTSTDGTLVETTSIHDNHASRGGAIFTGFASPSQGVELLELYASTLSGNSAVTNGGGLFIEGGTGATLYGVTVFNNRAHSTFPGSGTGGGVFVDSSASFEAIATLLADNRDSLAATPTSDCYGTLISGGYNFVSIDSGCTITGTTTGNLVGHAPTAIDPLVGPLEWLIDPTYPSIPSASGKPGHRPLDGSPLINAGPPDSCVPKLGDFTWDMIGQDRTLGGSCEIGAVEYGAIPRDLFADGFESGDTSAWSAAVP